MKLSKVIGTLGACLAISLGVMGGVEAKSQAPTNQLDAIVDRGVLRVGTTGDYKPLSYYDEKTGHYEGIEIDMAKSLADSLGVKVEFVKTTWPTLTQDTLAGKFDVAMSGITKTYARQKVADQSEGYITFGKTALIKASDKNRYKNLESLNQSTVKVGVNPGGTNEKFVRQNLSNATIIVHDKNAEIPGLVANGTFDVMITDSLEAERYAKENPALTSLKDYFTKNQFSVMMKRDQVLLNYVNMWLNQQKLEHKTFYGYGLQ